MKSSQTDSTFGEGSLITLIELFQIMVLIVWQFFSRKTSPPASEDEDSFSPSLLKTVKKMEETVMKKAGRNSSRRISLTRRLSNYLISLGSLAFPLLILGFFHIEFF